MITLSICIPTYRRPAMLKRCLLSAIDSAEGRAIKIFVADDSVSDINIEVLSDMRAKFPFVHWEVNAVNLGIDENIQRVLAMSDCDYAWMIGEDDVFLPGAIANMFDLVQTASYPFIFSNYQYVNEDHSRILGLALPDVPGGQHNAREFIEHSLWSVGFLGSCVLRRDVLARTSGAAYRGTYFTHVGRVVDILASSPDLYVSAKPGIANRAQGDDTFTWKKDSFGVFLGFERMCSIAAAANPSIAPSISAAARNYRAKFAYLSVSTTFRLRSEGAFDLRQYRVHIKTLDIEPWRKMWMLGLAVVPRVLIKPVASAYVAYKRARTVAS
jgi:glycosyltransferase involved in cell wall biosynthesis